MTAQSLNYAKYKLGLLSKENDYWAYKTILPPWANDAWLKTNRGIIRYEAIYF
jgi:hypothetical protein